MSDNPVPSAPPATTYEKFVLAHAAVFLIGATWAFGGNADFVQPYLGAWGTGGMLLTLIAGITRDSLEARGRLLRPLWPVLAFNAVTALACLTVGFRSIHSGSEVMYLPRQIAAWRPSAALPGLALRGLWLFDGIYFSAFNLSVAVRSRARLRGLFLIVLLNALALAVFGTLQKLTHASGIYFGRVHSPQPFFFSTFIYDNHWGAFIILVIGLCLGLIWYYADHADVRGFFHSPAFAVMVALLFLFITVPLSGARICSVLTLGFLIVALVRWLFRERRRQRRHGRRSWTAPLVAAAALAAGVAAAWLIGGDVIAARADKTVNQLHEFKAMHGLGSRSDLYHDTWRMAVDRPWWGWGMGSYPTVFQLYSSHTYSRVDLLPVFYSDAHSDWLQAVAEHGLIGAALLACCAGVPLLVAGRAAWAHRLSRHCFAGCGVVVLYALVEFPFGNYAVVLTWYLLFFGGIRYGALSGRRTAPP
jgi:O-antigen ligase